MTEAMDIDPFDLKSCLAIAREQQGDSIKLTTTLQALADESRHDLTVRSALAEKDVLSALVLRLQSSSDDYAVTQQTLRCVGNACASNPAAIRVVCEIGLQWLHRLCQQDSQMIPVDLRDTLAGVTYNLLAADFTSDGEEPNVENPAMRACYDAGVHDWLLQLLADKVEMRLTTDDLVDMLFWLSACATEDGRKPLSDRSITNILTQILPHPITWAAETTSTFVEAVASLLRPQAVRKTLAERFSVHPLLSLLETLEARISACRMSGEQQHIEDLSVLSPQASNVTWLLSDISAEPGFAKSNDLNHGLLTTCVAFLQCPTTEEQVFIASSLIVGNTMLNLDEASTLALIQQGIAGSVVTRLSNDSTSNDMLFAGAGLLSNLCRPQVTRESLGATIGLSSIIARLCKSETPQLSQAGLRLVRNLGRDCPANQVRLAPILEALPQQTNAGNA